MQLRRVEIRDFRKLKHCLVEGLGPGLNVVVGDNEAGKSTLLAALRAALFERYRVGGEVAQAMQPHGQSVRPEVAIEFDIAGEAWRLRKAFCQRPEAELTGAKERLSGDAVEERLAELFNFTPPGKGGSKLDQHQGAYGLLWVEQGAAHRSLGVGAGRDAIAAALESEVGQVLGGERGRALLAAAEKRLGEYWSKLGKPKGGWKELGEEIESLGEARTGLEARMKDHDGQVDQLEQVKAALARHARDDSLAGARKELETAERTMADIGRFDQAMKDAEAERRLASAQDEMAAQECETRARLIGKLGEVAKARETARVETEEAHRHVARYRDMADTARKALADAQASLDEANSSVTAIKEAMARRETQAELAKLIKRLADAENAERQWRENAAAAKLIGIDAAFVKEIDRLAADSAQKTAQRMAASARIDFHPEGERAVVIDGRQHAPGAAAHVSHDAEVVLQGFGRIVVHPGGGVAELARLADAAEQALGRRLAQHGLSDAGGARGELQRKLDFERDAETQRKLIAAIAPEGLDDLRHAVARHRAAVEQPLSLVAATLAEVTDTYLAALQAGEKAAQAAKVMAEAKAREAQDGLTAADRRLAILAERLAGAERDHAGLASELDQARRRAADEILTKRQGEFAAALTAAQAEHAEAAGALSAMEPEVARLRFKKSQNAVKSIEDDIATLARRKRDLEIALETAGRDGLGEQLAEIEGQLALKTRQHEGKCREAAAARLLHDVLMAAQRQSKDRWLGPIRQRVAPYLKLLRPDSDIVLDEETLEIAGFVRDGQEESFADLSVGAREQVAVITRLALADILRAANRPSAVILDDALVNTDEGRLERMHLVLHEAARHLQVLVLTCRERDFIRLGAPIIRMQ